MVMGRW